MNRVFIDMDGVLVDFNGYMAARGLTADEVKRRAGAYLDMLPIPGALEAVRSLIGMGWEVWIATKPPTGVPHAYADKAAWVLHYLPELKRRIIVTHDKGLLGDGGDYLVDDRPHKANCERFKGVLIPFCAEGVEILSGRAGAWYTWVGVLEKMRRAARLYLSRGDGAVAAA